MMNKEKEANKKLLTNKQARKRTVRDLVDEFFLPLDSFDSKKNLPKLQPNTQLVEDQDLYLLKVELPAFQKESFKIQVSKDKVTVYAEKVATEATEQTQTRKIHISDIKYGVFSKSYSFSSLVDPEHSKATFVDGLLTIVMPKLVIVEKTYFLKVE